MSSLVIAVACGGKPDSKPAAHDHDPPAPHPTTATAPAPATPTAPTPKDFLAKGATAFVLGTAGSDLADRQIAAQAGLIIPNFKGAHIIADTEVKPDRWPARPIVYGSPELNSAVAAIAGDLPFKLTHGHLELGGRSFDGDDIRLIAVVPATKHAPAFLYYAGAGTPGIAEINAIPLTAPITIADRFGVLATGTWDGANGATAKLDPPKRRVPWRDVSRTVAGTQVNVHFVAQLPAAPDEAAVVDAIAAGIAKSQTALAVSAQPAIEVYVYPDKRSKASLTDDGGDGTAVVEARTFHAVVQPPASLARLIAHEGTHLLGYSTWGPAGTPLLGEGLAVWAADDYQGKTLDQWKPSFTAAGAPRPTIADALVKGRGLGEQTLYTFGGLLMRVLLAQVGADHVKAHLLGATAAGWADACKAAGTTPEKLQAALDAELAR